MIRHKGRYKIRMVYTVPALNRDGKKEAPGLYLRESEDVRCRLSALVYLQNPGLQAIRLAVADLFQKADLTRHGNFQLGMQVTAR